MNKCLEGVKVLELTHYIAAPLCGQLLADMGAEVIKIENPRDGDVGRSFLPKEHGESLYYAAYNRNKRAITLNIQTESGQEILRKLVAQSDVVIENFRPGLLNKLGFGFSDLQKINPRIILTSVSGFGQNGPYKDRQGIDMMIQAMGGIMHMTGYPDEAPVRPGPTIADHTGAVYAALGTMFALFHRERTGQGQLVDIALLDAVFSLNENYPLIYLLQGLEVQRAGNGRALTAPSGAYQAQDGYVYITAMANNLFGRLMKLVGRPELADEPRFANPQLRKQHEAEINAVIVPWIAARTMHEAMQALDEAAIPNGPVNSIAQISTDPQIKARNMIWEVDHPTIGKLPLIGNPIKLSATPAAARTAPPLLGEHTLEVLTGVLGMTPEAVADLRAKHVI